MMIIREASVNDIPVLIQFQKNMAWETEKITLDDTVVQKGIENLFADAGKGKYFVAEANGKIAGCLMITYEWSDWRNGNVLWIQSVYVDQDWRGKGVYKNLYEHIQHMVKQRPDLRGIRLYVDKTNKDAQMVYQKLGMNGEHYQVFEWMKG